MKTKKLLYSLLAIAIILSAIGTVVFATEEGVKAGTITYGYVSQTDIWGELTTNATESVEIEIYAETNKIAKTTLNNIDNIIDGDVFVTWHNNFVGNFDEYWTTEWYGNNPTVDVVPTKVVLIADGVAVAENEVQMNGPDNLNKVVWEDLQNVSSVAKIGDKKYGTLQNAVDAAEAGDTITLLQDTTGSGVKIKKSITIDFCSYTYTADTAVGSTGTESQAFQILAGANAQPFDVTFKNGTIAVTEGPDINGKEIMVVIMNYSNLTLEDITVDGRGNTQMDCGLVNNNGNSVLTGETNVYVNDGVYAAIDVDGAQEYYNASSLTINTTGVIQGNVEIYGEEATTVINSGTFKGTFNSRSDANTTIYGGTFSNDVSACVAETSQLVEKDGSFIVEAKLPNAKVKKLGAIIIDEYTIWGNGDLTGPIDLQVAMEFIAKDTPEEAAKNAFGNYITDFYINIDGIANGSFIADDCYLAGHYEGYGWYVIPLAGMTIENDKVYPVLTSVSLEFTYKDICDFVKDFTCGIYFSDKVITENPDMQVTLTLGLSESLEDAQAAEFITVDQPYTYKVADFGKSEGWTTATDAGYVLEEETKLGTIRFLFNSDVESENIVSSGIKFIKESEKDDPASSSATTILGNSKTFYGDMVKIPESSKDNIFYAAAFIKTATYTIWSEAVECKPNFTKLLTK